MQDHPTSFHSSPAIDHVEHDGGGAFVIERDGRRLAEMTYASDTPGVMVIDHTEVLPELRGEGVAMRLLEAAVQRARSAGMRIEPTCSYARAVLQREPRFADVLRK